VGYVKLSGNKLIIRIYMSQCSLVDRGVCRWR
jgi:hypothetical protein